MSKIMIGIMGPGGKPTEADLKHSYEIGKACAQKDYVVLTGARPIGVMEAGLKGAKDGGGLTIGILPTGKKEDGSDYADLKIVTDMMGARNNINVLSSDIVVACGIESGTLSEIALGVKAQKNVIVISHNQKGKEFLKELEPDKIHLAETVDDVMALIEKLLDQGA